ncbi:ABC transporter permease, partial [Veillonellaceae bacterium M2-4]|nr:ABC transporter permease [Veillonellaceae bacterium M2-4]
SQSEAVTNLKTVKLTAKKSDVEQMNYLLQSLIGINKEIKFVSASNYQKVAGTVKQLTLIKTKNMVANYEKLLEVIKIQNPYPDELPPLTPMAYQMVTGLVSG